MDFYMFEKLPKWRHLLPKMITNLASFPLSNMVGLVGIE